MNSSIAVNSSRTSAAVKGFFVVVYFGTVLDTTVSNPSTIPFACCSISCFRPSAVRPDMSLPCATCTSLTFSLSSAFCSASRAATCPCVIPAAFSSFSMAARRCLFSRSCALRSARSSSAIAAMLSTLLPMIAPYLPAVLLSDLNSLTSSRCCSTVPARPVVGLPSTP